MARVIDIYFTQVVGIQVEIRSRLIDSAIILDISGALNLYVASLLRDTVDKKILEGHTRLIINLQDVDYIDSSGIGVLIICTQSLQKCGGALALVNASEDVKKVFALTCLEKYFNFLKNETEALSFFKQFP